MFVGVGRCASHAYCCQLPRMPSRHTMFKTFVGGPSWRPSSNAGCSWRSTSAWQKWGYIAQPTKQFWDHGAVKLESLYNFSIVGCQWTVNCLLGMCRLVAQCPLGDHGTISLHWWKHLVLGHWRNMKQTRAEFIRHHNKFNSPPESQIKNIMCFL